MAGAAGVCCLAALLSLADTATHNHSVEAETYHVSAGRLFLLKCPTAIKGNVTWSRGPASPRLPDGVEVREDVLWFLPVQASHNGSYTCERRDEKGPLRIDLAVSVSSGICPDPSEVQPIQEGVNSDAFSCKQTEIFTLNATREIKWLKDCEPVKPERERLSVDKDGTMRLFAVTEGNAGNYTCVVDVSLNGMTYTSARSIQLTLVNESISRVPIVLFPEREVVVVEVGARVELKCVAYIGHSEDSEMYSFWMVNDTFAEEMEGCEESEKYVHKRGRVNLESTLTISEVTRCFLNVPICCRINSPIGRGEGCLSLQEADSSLYTSVFPCLATSVTLLLLAAAFCFFKVDAVLAYRKVLRHFAKPPQDVELYDAYVSFLHPNALGSAKTANFALEVLPEQLEKRHGYSLYIRGRDDCPGEAVHDAIAATMRKCCRLIIILSDEVKHMTNGKTDEGHSLCDNPSQLCYEQKLGLYDALTQNNLRVILVEIDCPVDYKRLPESLRFVKRKQGSLRWEMASPGTCRPNPHKLPSNRRFWKNLRYQMPSVPVRRCQTTV